MPSLSTVRAFNASRSFSYHPVAVFVGGTSGIGRGMAEAFARHTEGKCSIYLVGRNEAAAKTILDGLEKPSTTTPQSSSSESSPTPSSSSSGYKREFVPCDARFMSNVHTAAQTILSKEPKINFLVLSPGILTMQGYTVPKDAEGKESEEGIDEKMAVHYYARWRFIWELRSALDKASSVGEGREGGEGGGEDSVVVSVLAAGKGGAIDLDDLDLRKRYSVTRAGLVTPTYNDLMMESFASRHPKTTFVHTHPSFVRTNLAASSNSTSIRLLTPLLNTLFYPLSTSQDETGEYMWYGVYHAQKGQNNRVGSRGEDLGKTRYIGTDEQREKLWEHTVEKTRVSVKPVDSAGAQ